MQLYDTVLIGSGYCSVGYAVANGNTLIVEEQEIADTHFYLPLRAFHHTPYTPRTEEGRALDGVFRSLCLFSEDRQNVNGFECALCRYLEERSIPLLLKCRVVHRTEADGQTVLTLSTNEGLLTVGCRRVIDTRSTGPRSLSVLVCPRGEEELSRIAELTGSRPTPAFYPGQYLLRLAARGLDENRIKPEVHDLLSGVEGLRILAIAPVFAAEGVGAPLSDDDYDNPIAAFEAGYALSKEAAL